jgi:Ran GTPase-activating protein (RanGAP) involved in mRNA processing and transport
LDLSGNPIEDKGMIALADFLKKYSRGLTYLNLSDCGSGSKGTHALLDALTQNDVFSKTLQTLKISGNRLDTEGTKSLVQFMSKTGVLSKLAIANTNVNFPELRACVPLHSLDISENKITKKFISDIAKFLPQCTNLKTLKLAKTYPPAECLTELFKISLPKLKELNISDNEFSDEAMVTILEHLMNYDVLNTLNLSGNFNKNKQKHRHALVDSLVAIVARKHNPVEHLVMHSPKNPLKHDILPFILSLIDPKIRLRSLDISDHEIGDVGACSLGKVLQTNHCLATITWDGNATTVTGLDFFLHGLMRNQGVKEHFIPVCDVAAIIKKAGESSATTATVQPLVELMQDRVATITRESVNVNKLNSSMRNIDSPVSPKQHAVRSLKPRRSESVEELAL